jgi:peptide/nickel transport system substrate-binding protein
MTASPKSPVATQEERGMDKESGVVGRLPKAPRPRRRSLTALAATIVVASIALSACDAASPSVSGSATPGGQASAGTPSAAPSPSAIALPVAGTVLNVCVPTLGAQDFTPWLAGNEEEIVTREVGDVLIRINEKGELIPSIATSWTLSPDLSAWTFKIRDDVPFQGGYGNVTSEDVRYSFEQYLNPDSNQSLSNLLRRALQDDIKNFEVVSPTEFKIHMDPKNPVVYVDSLVPGLPINSKNYFEQKGAAANSHPIGSGPYEFVSSSPGLGVVLKAVPNHWRQTAYYETVNLNIVADEAAGLSQLKTGECDLAPLSPSLLAEAEAAGVKGYEVKDVGTGSMVFGGMYYEKPEKNDCAAPWVQCDGPEKGRAIREALSLAIDRQTILDKIFLGHGSLTHAGAFEWPASRPVTTDPSWTLPEFNPEKAKAKLAEGGYPNGFTFDQWIYFDQPGTIEAGQAVAGMWEDIGLKVNQQVVDYRLIVREGMRSQDTKGHVWMRFNSNYPETVQTIDVGHSKTSNTQAYNWPLVDDYRAKLVIEPDKAKREALSLELMTKMREEFVMAPLYTLDQTWGASSKVGTWNPVGGYGGSRPTNIEGITPAS